MPTESILLSSTLTTALAEVSKRKGPEGATAGHSELSQATREALQAGFHELKDRMGSIEEKTNAGNHGLKLSMGMYQASGRYFPHIWGAYIPAEAGRCSRVTTQLYVFRKDNAISWGICPSDAAMKDDKFMEAFRASLSQHREQVQELFSKGFRGRVGRSHEAFDSAEEFLKSDALTLSRIFPITSDLTIDKFETLFVEDLKALLPLYISCVSDLRSSKKFWIAPKAKDETEKRYWLIAAGPIGEMWDAFKSDGIVAISFQELQKSILDYSDRDEIQQVLKSASNEGRQPTHNSLGCYEFAHTIKPGDLIFAKAGPTKLLGFGEVTSEYVYDKSKADYQHIRKVKWISVGPWTLPQGDLFVTKTLTDISDYQGYPEQLMEIAGVGDRISPAEKSNPQNDSREIMGDTKGTTSHSSISLEKLCELTNKDSDFYQSIRRRLEEKKQVIFYGPPGTGKTFIANAFANWFQDGSGLREQVQFHPSYSYEDFIEGFRPDSDAGKTGFALKAGVFKQFCERAAIHKDQKHIFIIDELNRGNLAQVFGELLYALEYRGQEVTLPYSGIRFTVPSNVYLIGTMNSADRSIAIIDFAIRRRFDFFEFSPDPVVLKRYLESANCNTEIAKLLASFTKLNGLIRERRGKQYEIGHSFWMQKGMTQAMIKDIWEYNIRPLLDEYFFDDPGMVQKIAEEAWGFLEVAQVAA